MAAAFEKKKKNQCLFGIQVLFPIHVYQITICK